MKIQKNIKRECLTTHWEAKVERDKLNDEAQGLISPLKFSSEFCTTELHDNFAYFVPGSSRDAEVLEDVFKSDSPEKPKTVYREDGFLDPEHHKYSVGDLTSAFPEGVKPSQKEAYLTDEQFLATLGMPKETFYAKKLWRQQELKKKAGLF